MDEDKQRAIEALQRRYFFPDDDVVDGYERWSRYRGDLNGLVESVKFFEEGPAEVLLVVPVADIPTFLSPLSMEMVKSEFVEWLQRQNEVLQQIGDRHIGPIRIDVEASWKAIEDRLRKQVEGGGGDG